MKSSIIAILLTFVSVSCGYGQAVSSYSVGDNQPALSGGIIPDGNIIRVRDFLVSGAPANNNVVNAPDHNIDGFTRGRTIQLSDFQNGELPLYVRFSVTSGSNGIDASQAVTMQSGEEETDIFESTAAFVGGFATGSGSNVLFQDGDGIVAPNLTSVVARGLGLAEGPATPSRVGVDGFERREIGRPFGPRVYWTVDEATLSTLEYSIFPMASAADIYIAPVANGFTSIPRRFASATQLGLDPDEDDIDALEIIDRGTIGKFDAADIILFSLNAGSGTLGGPAVNPANSSPADIFIVTGGSAPVVFLPAADLGLTRTSNVSALMVTPIPNP